MTTTKEILNKAYDEAMKYLGIKDIDYAAFDRVSMKVTDMDDMIDGVIGELGSEGTWIDFYYQPAKQPSNERYYCGCVKTLSEGLEAHKEMGALLGVMEWNINKIMCGLYADGILE